MDEIKAIAQQQGWNDTSLLELCLEYIGNQQDDQAAFVDFLLTKALAENDPT